MDKIAYIKSEQKFDKYGISCYLGKDRDFSWFLPLTADMSSLILRLLELEHYEYKVVWEYKEMN